MQVTTIIDYIRGKVVNNGNKKGPLLRTFSVNEYWIKLFGITKL